MLGWAGPLPVVSQNLLGASLTIFGIIIVASLSYNHFATYNVLDYQMINPALEMNKHFLFTNLLSTKKSRQFHWAFIRKLLSHYFS